jgi:hypothetical protein
MVVLPAPIAFADSTCPVRNASIRLLRNGSLGRSRKLLASFADELFESI